MKFIEIKGASEHNLKEIDVRVPLNRITFIIGPSGSGKSTLASDVLYSEGRLRYMEALDLAEKGAERIRRPKVREILRLPPPLLLEQLQQPASSASSVATLLGLKRGITRLLEAAGTALCPKCGSPIQVFELRQLALHLLSRHGSKAVSIMAPVDLGEYPVERLLALGFVRAAAAEGDTFYLDELTPEEMDRLNSQGAVEVVVDRLKVSGSAANRLLESLQAASELSGGRIVVRVRSGGLEQYCLNWFCSSCGAVVDQSKADRRLMGMGLKEWLGLDAGALKALLQELSEEADGAVKVLAGRLITAAALLEELCLSYLALDRPASTLSAGELHKIALFRLYRQEMAGLLYVLDEPLSRYDRKEQARLWRFIKGLSQMGNTVVLVEHDLYFLNEADWLIELGPGAGERGGQVLYQGPPERWQKKRAAGWDDGRKLRGTAERDSSALGVKERFRLELEMRHPVRIRMALSLPRRGLVSIIGPAGSGKSALLAALSEALRSKEQERHLYWLPRVLKVGSAHSMVASYAGIWGEIRRLFSRVPEARSRGLTPSYFSLTRKGGRCEHCRGLGMLRHSLPGMPLVEEVCPVCGGMRYSRDLMGIKYKGYWLGEILELPVAEAVRLFGNLRKVQQTLSQLARFGLEYLRLGQPVKSLSGGERQRLRLIQLGLWQKKGRPAVFFLDEPSSGLSPPDRQLLLDMISWLAHQGSLIVAADNAPFLSSAAELVVEMGPGAGPEGGRIVKSSWQ